jgi:Domain of Unknown Function (DUF1259)
MPIRRRRSGTENESDNGMKKIPGPLIAGLAAILILAAALAPAARAQALPAKQLGKILEQTPMELSGGVLKFTWLRTDLHVRVGRVEVEPALALRSWAAFESAGESRAALVTGELAVTESESQKAIDALQAANFNVTGVGDHLNGESPRVTFIDFTAGGLPADLAASLMKALRESATPMRRSGGTHLLRATENEPGWTAAVRSALGRKGAWHDRVLTINIPRNDEIRIGLTVATPPMGTSVSLHFQSAGAEVASAGQIVLLNDEVNPVIAELRRHGIEVAALGDHLLNESPRLFFVHYWAVGKPTQIAAALAGAMNRINVRAPK